MLRLFCTILLFSLLLSSCSRKRVPSGKVSIRQDDGIIHCSFNSDNIRVKKVYYYPNKKEYIIKGSANALKYNEQFPDSSKYMILVESRNNTNNIIYPDRKGKFKIRLTYGYRAYFTYLQENMYINNIAKPGKYQDGGIWIHRYRTPKNYYSISKKKVKIIPLQGEGTNNINFEVMSCKRYLFRKYKPTFSDTYNVLLTLKEKPNNNGYEIIRSGTNRSNTLFTEYNADTLNIWMNHKDTLLVRRVDSIPVTSMKIFIR